MANVILIPNNLGGLNYSLAPSVASNNLTLAIKDAAGNTPSSTSPCVFRIGGSERILSTSLSVTTNAGTNWANLGSATFATKETDVFAYIVWNTNTSALDVLWSRIPYATVYSDFSTTNTEEKYGAINATAPAITDDVVNIGRFAFTLSAGAGYTFTVPTFTSSNLINHPIFETRPLSWIPTWTNLTVGDATVTYWYQRMGRRLRGAVSLIAGATTSISGSVSHTMPFGRSSTYGATVNFPNWICRLFDATAAPAFQGIANMATTSAVTITAQNASGTYLKQANLSSTVPFTWTTSDQIAYEFDYLAD